MGRKLGLLGDDGGVNIADPMISSPDHLPDLPEEDEAGDALELRIGIGEVLADVPQPRRPE
jgi:hypothetical protein